MNEQRLNFTDDDEGRRMKVVAKRCISKFDMKCCIDTDIYETLLKSEKQDQVDKSCTYFIMQTSLRI